MDKSLIKVLVLDDEPFMLKLLRHQLATLGFTQVTTCDNGVAALTLLGGTHAATNLVLCDLMMPDMDGAEFIRHLVGTGYAGSVILVSGVDRRILEAAENLVAAHGIDLLGHLQKPVSPRELEKLLTQWLPASPHARASRASYSTAEIRAAIANNELVNHYQPKVLVASGELIGVEALVRWNHPTDGMVFPDQFIAEAESQGLIGDLTCVVLDNALRDASQWQQAGLALRMAVNVSMESLSDLDFPAMVARRAALAAVSPQQVMLEVTESRLMKDPRAALEILTRLRLKGFGLSIDDFGTGHASLAQLRDLPFNQLKIDRGFVHGAWTNRTRQAIFQSSLEMGTQLQLEIVAEGVEDRADWDFLRHTGCRFAQGYFIAKPLSARELFAWAAVWPERLRTELAVA